MEYNEAVAHLFTKLGHKKIMAIAASVNDQVSIRNVSCIMHDQKIFFKTDMHFPKTKQLLKNPNVALCYWGVQIEGIAVNHGLLTQETNHFFQPLYEKYWKNSYNAYCHENSEILIEIVPSFVEIWDQDSEDKGFQTLIDFKKETVELEYYD